MNIYIYIYPTVVRWKYEAPFINKGVISGKAAEIILDDFFFLFNINNM